MNKINENGEQVYLRGAKLLRSSSYKSMKFAYEGLQVGSFPWASYDQKGQGNIYFVEEEESGIEPDLNYESNMKSTPNVREVQQTERLCKQSSCTGPTQPLRYKTKQKLCCFRLERSLKLEG